MNLDHTYVDNCFWFKTGTQVWFEVGNHVSEQAKRQTGSQVYDQVWIRLGVQVRDQVYEEINKMHLEHACVWRQVRIHYWYYTDTQVGSLYSYHARNQIKRQFQDQVRAQVWHQVWAHVWDQVKEQVKK